MLIGNKILCHCDGKQNLKKPLLTDNLLTINFFLMSQNFKTPTSFINCGKT